MNGRVIIRRYHPQRDAEPYDQEFLYHFEEHMTVLDVLHLVAREQDATLRYQYCCRSGHCKNRHKIRNLGSVDFQHAILK